MIARGSPLDKVQLTWEYPESIEQFYNECTDDCDFCCDHECPYHQDWELDLDDDEDWEVIEDDYDDPMDGDHESAFESIGWGVDEDY